MIDSGRRARCEVLVAIASLAIAACRSEESTARPFAPERPISIQRTRLAEGLDLIEADVDRNGGGTSMFMVLFDPDRYELGLQINPGNAFISTLDPEALVLTNGGFFTPERRATGLLALHGRLLSPLVAKGGSAGSGVFMLEETRPSLLDRTAAATRSFESVAFAIQAGPRIIEPGAVPGIRSDDGQRAHRTVIGATSSGRPFLAVVYGLPGVSLYELQSLFSRLGRGDKDLAVDFALNLDGGPSTGLELRTSARSLSLKEGAPVHNVISIRARP